MSLPYDDKKVEAEHLDVATSKGLEYESTSDVIVKGVEYGDANAIRNDGGYILDAEQAAREQKTQTLVSALSQYKPAIFWSLVLSSGKTVSLPLLRSMIN